MFEETYLFFLRYESVMVRVVGILRASKGVFISVGCLDTNVEGVLVCKLERKRVWNISFTFVSFKSMKNINIR